MSATTILEILQIIREDIPFKSDKKKLYQWIDKKASHNTWKTETNPEYFAFSNGICFL